MIQDIKYNGYSASPSDYECQDGDLACAVGLISDAGAMTPVLPPKTLFTLSEGKKVVFIHETSAFKHYIISDEMTTSATLSWMSEGDSDTTTLSWVSGYVGVQAIGNTLMIICEERVLYFLWQEGSYNYLGDHIPDVDISFGLVGRPRLFSVSDESKSTISISFDYMQWTNIKDFSDNNATKITETVMAKVNKFIKEQTIDKGRFCFPFFVRYALRLYDGSLVGHSAPILMNPSTSACPVAFVSSTNSDGTGFSTAKVDIMLVAASLDYCLHNTRAGSLSKWTDIIKSIDVFISKPIYTFDQNGKIESLYSAVNNAHIYLKGNDFETSSFIGRLYAKATTSADSTKEDCIKLPFTNEDIVADLSDMYSEWEYRLIYSMYFASSNRQHPLYTFGLPKIDVKDVNETIADTSTFFKLHSIDFKSAALACDSNNEERQDIEIDEDYLESLVTREVMTDDYLTHDQFIPTGSMVYNQRLNLFNVKRKPFEGFPMRSMLAFHNYFYNWTTTDSSTIKIEKLSLRKASYTVKVLIRENGESYGVEYSAKSLPQILSTLDVKYGLMQRWYPLLSGPTNFSKATTAWGSYFFYPNANAYKMIIYDENLGVSREVALQSHNFLNGAYAFLGYSNTHSSSEKIVDTGSIPFDTLISVPNKIYTSEVNNPFYFPLLGINTIGTGNIIGISTAAKALSEGQFGQFPLYAFTTDGVWALEVSSTGSYSARQPITRDVCVNADSITQIDSAVLFATDRGIMLLSGSQSQCISDILDSKEAFTIVDLPYGEQLISKSELADSDFNIVPFREFLAGCRMLYDYTHQHIIVYNPSHTYAYVYSLESKSWGMTHSNIASGVNSYPEALAMTHAGELIDFSQSDVTQGLKGVLVTRPLKLGAHDQHKTIDTIIQRGHFRKGHIKVALYGSRDLYNWFLISSSNDHYLRGFRGTPYKYFRLAILCDLDHDESLYGCTVQFTSKLINQLR